MSASPAPSCGLRALSPPPLRERDRSSPAAPPSLRPPRPEPLSRAGSGKEQWGSPRGRQTGKERTPALAPLLPRGGTELPAAAEPRPAPGEKEGGGTERGEAGLRAPFCSVPSPPQPSSPRSGPTPRPGYRCRSRRVLLRAGARLAARALRRHLPAVTAPARSAARSRVAAAAARRLTPSPPVPGPPAARSLTPPAPRQRRAAGRGDRVPALGHRAVGFPLLSSAPRHQAARSQAEAGERDPAAGRPPFMVAEGSAPGTARPAGTALLPARLRGSGEWRERIEEKKERACAVWARLTCPVRPSRSLGRKVSLSVWGC